MKIALSTFAVIFLFSSHANEASIKRATNAAKKWLAVVDTGSYGKSWKEASSLFKNQVPSKSWISSLKKVRTPLGKLTFRKLKNAEYRTALPGAPDGQYVVIQFESRFTNKANAIETITPMADKDGSWRVSGYYIK